MQEASADPRLEDLLAELGVAAGQVEALAGDASTRRFFRIWRQDGAALVVSLYPPGSEGQVAHDAAVQTWGTSQQLPIPRQLGVGRTGVASEDVGDENLELALARHGTAVVGALVEALGRFARCPWQEAPNPPFDPAFFRRELAVFEALAGLAEDRESRVFLDTLAERLGRHPFRLAHRDFHLHNLFSHRGAVIAVDFQDLRGGPDTYDAASLLRERGGSRHLPPTRLPLSLLASALGWSAGWGQRFLECAAQRGLKVMGTFLRLASLGRHAYLRFLPEARSQTLAALAELQAPAALLQAVSRPLPLEEVYSPRGGNL